MHVRVPVTRELAGTDEFHSTFLAAGVNPAQAVFIEMFITTALVLSVLMLAAEKHSVTPFAPVRYARPRGSPWLTT